jgi:hypothetical protein
VLTAPLPLRTAQQWQRSVRVISAAKHVEAPGSLDDIGGIVKHVLALSRSAVIVRHWFEIDLQDSSMEHGARIELRELANHTHRGSESAAQLVMVDRPLWRADLFDRYTDAPGSFGVAHYHPRFRGSEPCRRVWDSQLQADPWRWLEDQFVHVGQATGEPWPLEAADAAELSRLAPVIVSLSQQFGPDRCTSAAQCFEWTRDARDAVQLMLDSVRRPDLLDEKWVSPWRAPA